jgi:prepilin-type N-terminal cleavage/methylation domain-containing protein
MFLRHLKSELRRHDTAHSACRAVTTLRRRGFTLVELLIVVSVLLILAVMVASAINVTISGDKVRAGARQVQSYLAGARDRAIYAREPRGVRFLLDPTNNRTVSSMVFIGPTDPWSQGAIQIERLDADNDGIADSTAPFVVRGFDNDPGGDYRANSPTDWYNLFQQGMIINGSTRIKIPNDDTGQWYTFTTELLFQNNPRLHLTTAYQGPGQPNPTAGALPAFAQNSGPVTYLMELPPTVLPNQEVVLLPKGSVVHLDRCSNNFEQVDNVTPASGRGNKLPDYWKNFPSTSSDPSGFDYISRMDVMFSPRGVVVGNAAQRGIIHLYIADQKDADRDRLYWGNPSSYPTVSAPEYGVWADPTAQGYERGDHVILSIFTRTGAVSTHQIYSNTDPFRLAETGEVAGK